MKKIQVELTDNPYIRNDILTTQFTMLVDDAISQHPVLNQQKQFEYVHGFIKYPHWNNDADLFCNIDEDNLKRLQSNEIFFILDASVEGYSPIHQIPFFDILHYNCEKYNVNPEQVIFVSANLLDEKNYENYSKSKNKKLKIFSFNFFEKVAEAPLEWRSLIENGEDILPKITLENVKAEVEKNFQDKLFSSLSRLNRYQRTIATFLLSQHPASKHALISHNKLKLDKPDIWLQVAGLQDYGLDNFLKWLDSLPLIIDHDDFETNWAIQTPYAHIHHKTLFQIVNETYQSNFNNTSLFYSEKTFRPMICMQPFIIYGQPGCNRYLKELGYITYDDYFNLSFDDEPNDTVRYKLILEIVSKLCSQLETMSRQEQIKWRFKREDILMHNFKVMRETAITKNKIIKFLTEEIYGTTNTH
jgi:hypothetical protein